MRALPFPLTRTLSLLLFSAFTSALKAQDPHSEFDRFTEAFTARKYGQCIVMGKELQKHTDHPYFLYQLAECYCQAGKFSKCLDLLGKLAKRGVSYKIEENRGFWLLYGNQRFSDYEEMFIENRFAIDKSVSSFVINDSLLLPEGIAYDSLHQTFYVGSLARHKVIRCSAEGSCSDFALGSQSGFWMVLGMKVSPDCQSLWICSASEKDSINGYSGIFQFEIPSGKLIRKYIVDNRNGAHFFNDLVVTPQGEAYFTDSKAGIVWQINAAGNGPEPYAKGFSYPNGIAVDNAKKVLFVADFQGIHVIDLLTRNQFLLNHQGKTFTNGVDGLYWYKGALVGIQATGKQDDRVVRFFYNLKKKSISRTEILQSYRSDFNGPTTGAIANGYLHYISNSQADSLQSNESVTHPEKLVKPVILKVKLD